MKAIKNKETGKYINEVDYRYLIEKDKKQVWDDEQAKIIIKLLGNNYELEEG